MKRIVVWILAIIVVTGVLAGAAPRQESRMKNLKVLTGMPDAEVTKEMNAWGKALGVRCSHCHTVGDFASDEVPAKETARRMATMVKTINKDFFKGENKVTCAHCHRGASTPTLEGGQ